MYSTFVSMCETYMVRYKPCASPIDMKNDENISDLIFMGLRQIYIGCINCSFSLDRSFIFEFDMNPIVNYIQIPCLLPKMVSWTESRRILYKYEM